MQTPVIFRAERGKSLATNPGASHVTAVFPTIPSDTQGLYWSCYSHVGQHGSCSRAWYNMTRAAKPEEYADLKRELESAPYGYQLKICRRLSRLHREAFNAASKRFA